MSSAPKIISRSHISARPDVPTYLLDIRKFWWSRRNQDSDLVLVSGTKTVNIHQAVILPLSSFLRGIVPYSCPCIQPAIVLPPVPPDALDALVELLYLGRSTAGAGDVEGKVAELLALLWINVDIYRDHGGEDTNAGENQNEEFVNESVAKGIVQKTHLPTGPDAKRTGRKRNAMEPNNNHDKKVRKSATDRDFNSSVKNLESSSRDQRNQESKYCCDQCDSKFTRKESLVLHIDSVNAKVKYPCNQCDLRACNKKHLLRHVEAVHGKVSPSSRATRKSNRSNHPETISGNASHSNDNFYLRSSRNTRQSRQTETSKRVPDSEAVKKCSVRIMKLDRYQLGVRKCEVRILRISTDERIAGREIGQATDLANGTNSEIEEITKDDDEEIEEVPRNDGNCQSTALVTVGTGANEVIEEILRDEDIEEVTRNDDDVIRVTSLSITITRKKRK